MTIEQLKVLTQEEINHLLDAVPLITVLVAGADGHIEDKERAWARKITNIRSFASNKLLQDYYQSVGEIFSDRVDYWIEHLSDDTDERNQSIVQELVKMNPILAKLDQTYAANLYESFVSFGKHVAKAAGGFLSFFTISAEEKEWIKLPMLTPITIPEE